MVERYKEGCEEVTDSDLHAGDKAGQWRDFLKQKCRKQIGELSREFPHKRSLMIDYKEVEKFGSVGPALADEIMANPGKVMEDIHDAIIANTIIKQHDGKVPKGLNIRFHGCRKKTSLRDLRHEDVNTFVSINVITISASEVRPRISEAVFRCPSGHFTHKPQKYGKFVEPASCGTDGCQFRKLDLVPARSKFTNQQKLKVQDNEEGLKPGQQPQTIEVIALDDICDTLFAGDRATINGILRSVQRVVRGERSTIFDFYIELSSIEAEERDFDEVNITPEAEEKIKEIAKGLDPLDQIARSISPTIYAANNIKQAIALQLFGGVNKENADGTMSRGFFHILIVGEPGTGKSKLIRNVAHQSPRGMYATMKSASAVGLIGTTIKDEGDNRYRLEAGSLAMADNGIHALDELDKAPDDIRDTLYEVMEDGLITIQKATVHRTLRARDSILGAANPKYERFDLWAEGGLADQINMKPAFLSRFDLIFIMTDVPEKTRDTAVAQHIATTHRIGECKAAGKHDKVTDEEKAKVIPEIDPQLLRQYIAYARRNVFPIMNPTAYNYLVEYYTKTRGEASENKPVPITARALEATIRLSEAMARIRLSGEVALKDAERAVSIFDACIREVATDRKTGQLDSGRIGDGLAQAKKNMIGVMREVMLNEPNLSEQLLLAKMAERSFIDPQKVRVTLDEAKRAGDVLEPRRDHYQWIGK